MANAQKKTSGLILFTNRKTNTAKLPCAFGVHCSAIVLNLNSLATFVAHGFPVCFLPTHMAKRKKHPSPFADLFAFVPSHFGGKG